MFCHFLVSAVQYYIVPRVLCDTGFEVVRYEDASDTTKIPVSVYMGGNPTFLCLIQKRLHLCVPTARENCNKDKRRYFRTCF